MKFVIDSGNTLVKAGVFSGDQLTYIADFDKNSVLSAGQFVRDHKISFVVVSEVSDLSKQLIESLPADMPIIRVTGQTPVPINVQYKTTETLGADRLAAVMYAAHHYPGSNVLVIQTGTCITYDLITKDNEYIGGAISPGLDMKLKALNTFTARLPLIKKKEYHSYTGLSTEECILAGVMLGSIAEIDGMINLYRQKYTGIRVILGGGDQLMVRKMLKNKVITAEHLVLKGLNLISDYNVKLGK